MKVSRTTECEGQCWWQQVDSHGETMLSFLWGREVVKFVKWHIHVIKVFWYPSSFYSLHCHLVLHGNRESACFNKCLLV